MVQEYLSAVKTRGDVRILLLDGEIMGAMRRVPASGCSRTNSRAGARICKHEVTDGERQVCETVRERLAEDGLYFVGIDVIDDRLVDVKCVSPGGIPSINHLDGIRLETRIIDFVEEKVAALKAFHWLLEKKIKKIPAAMI